MSMDLPKPIADYVEANARLDIDGMLKPFLSDAVFIDNGKRFEGQAAIRKLLDDEVVPVKAIFTPDKIREEDGQVVVEGGHDGRLRALGLVGLRSLPCKPSLPPGARALREGRSHRFRAGQTHFEGR